MFRPLRGRPTKCMTIPIFLKFFVTTRLNVEFKYQVISYHEFHAFDVKSFPFWWWTVFCLLSLSNPPSLSSPSLYLSWGPFTNSTQNSFTLQLVESSIRNHVSIVVIFYAMCKFVFGFFHSCSCYFPCFVSLKKTKKSTKKCTSRLMAKIS